MQARGTPADLSANPGSTTLVLMITPTHMARTSNPQSRKYARVTSITRTGTVLHLLLLQLLSADGGPCARPAPVGVPCLRPARMHAAHDALMPCHARRGRIGYSDTYFHRHGVHSYTRMEEI